MNAQNNKQWTNDFRTKVRRTGVLFAVGAAALAASGCTRSSMGWLTHRSEKPIPQIGPDRDELSTWTGGLTPPAPTTTAAAPAPPAAKSPEPLPTRAAHLIPLEPPPSNAVASPTLIFRESNVVLYAPPSSSRGMEAPVRSVILTKLSGPGKGSVFRERLHEERASFHGLTPGAYEVEYSTQSTGTFADDPDDRLHTRSPMRRRIIIELNPHDSIATSRVEGNWTRRLGIETDTGARKPKRDLPPLIARSVAERTERGWKLLHQNQIEQARCEFVAAVEEAAGPRPNARWRELLSCAAKVQFALRNASDLSALSEEMSDAVGRNPELCRTFFGLGKSLESSRRPTVGAVSPVDALARVCYQTATTLDATCGEAWNDLGVLEHRAGLLPPAIAALARAADLLHSAPSLYNLGRCLTESGDLPQALECQLRAIEADPQFGPAVYEAARLQMLPNAPACYLADCRNLARQLHAAQELLPDGSRERAWATKTSEEIAFLAKEEAQNSPGLATRVLTGGSERPQATSEPAMARLRSSSMTR